MCEEMGTDFVVPYAGFSVVKFRSCSRITSTVLGERVQHEDTQLHENMQDERLVLKVTYLADLFAEEKIPCTCRFKHISHCYKRLGAK